MRKHSPVQRGKLAARLLEGGMVFEEVAIRCNLSQEMVLQVLVKAIRTAQDQVAERLAVVQRLYQVLADQLNKGVVYPTATTMIETELMRRQPVDAPQREKQRK
jgi:hypothetical protein